MSAAAVAGAEALGACRKGRPRDERIDTEITAAALAVLAEVGFDGFSVEAVAARAGVAKTSIYRRFPGRTELVIGALERLNDDLPPPPPPGPVRDRLLTVLGGVRRPDTLSTRWRIMMHAAAAGNRDPELADLVQSRVLAPRRALLRSLIVDGIDTGELRSDIDLAAVVPALVGPMLYLGIWAMCDHVDGVTTEAVVDTLLRGLTPATDS